MNFRIKHAFNLKSADSKLLLPGQIFPTDDEAQIKELREVFAKDGACEEIKTKEAVKADVTKAPDNPDDDLSTVPGVGKTTLEKLAKKNITTVAQLKAAVLDASKDEEMKEVFGPMNVKKVKAHFEAA